MKSKAKQHADRGVGKNDNLFKTGMNNSLTKPKKFVQNRTEGQVDVRYYYDNFQTAGYGSLIETVMKEGEKKGEAKEEANAAVLRYYGGSKVCRPLVVRFFLSFGGFFLIFSFLFLAVNLHFSPPTA